MKLKDYNPGQIVIEPPRGLFNFNFRELIAYDEWLFFLIWWGYPRPIPANYRGCCVGAGFHPELAEGGEHIPQRRNPGNAAGGN